MESSFYNYYFVSKDCLSNKWVTNEVEKFIIANNDFEQKGYGDFSYKRTFCNIQLMNIKNYDSWSSNDYNKVETNYISIVTSKEPTTEISEFLKEFEFFLGWHICQEIDDNL